MEDAYGNLDNIFEQQVSQQNYPVDKQAIMEVHLKKMTQLVRKEMSWENIKGPIIEAYATVYTEEEVQELVAFYKTPVGQKMMAKLPQLMQTTKQLVKQSMQGLGPKLWELQLELQQEMQKSTE